MRAVTQAAESASLVGFALEERYHILREIGRGGMGIVYEAEHVDLGKRVAIKVMLEKYADDDEAVTRFKREALAASRIGNPHIIDVSHIGAAPDGRPFVVMELLDGEPLSKVLERTGPMPPWRAVHIMRQVLRAVGAAHAKGIIHRDLKPDNIFIVNRDDQHDFVKLLDFGISKMIDTGEQMAATRLTTTGVVMGTPLYMAPEQATGSGVDHRVDLYAAGVILFEMLSGRPPFNETNYNLLVAKLITATPPHLDDLRRGLPAALVTAVHRALEKDPDHRFTSAEAFAQSLPTDRAISEPNLEIAHTLPPGVSLHAPPRSLARPPASRKGWLIGIGAVVVAIGAAAIVGVVVSGDSSKPATPPAPAPVVAPAPAPEAPAPPPAPAPATGKLEIKTIPSGATVKLDKADAGTTPLEVTLAPGAHRIHVELAGYLAVDADEDIHAAERTSAVITLQKGSSHTIAAKPHVETHKEPTKPAPPHDIAKTVPPEPGDGSKPSPFEPTPHDTPKTAPGTKPNPY
jgi:eukaryotic-like serine/threonine-protein kinase